MNKDACSRFLLFAIFFSLPCSALADFVIEFSDGRQVTVGHYVDEEQMITIHTARGKIGFRKADVKRITPVSADQSPNGRLEVMVAKPPVPTEQLGKFPPQTKGSASAVDEMNQGNQKGTVAEGKLTKAAIERLDGQYHSVAQEMDGLWEKHTQDIETGASAEALAENRRLLHTLDQERNKLIKAVRRATPDTWPAWAR